MPQKSEQPVVYRAVDLFAGGGGLTVGLKQAGFSVVGAVEIEPHAFATYKINHPEVRAYKQDIRSITGNQLGNDQVVHLLAGCPPCQGFSSLTSKYKRRRDDRNTLVREMGRVISEVKPLAIMMENVPGLVTKAKGRKYFTALLKQLKELGYKCEYAVLQVADYGVPQSRRRLVLLAGKGFSIPMPKPTHGRDPKPSSDRQPWVPVSTVLKGMPKAVTITEANLAGGPDRFNWHVVRSLSAENKLRLKKAKPGESRGSLPKKLRPDCHKKSDLGFGNVYGRMSGDRVSPSITGGCTTLSKGRFGHPTAARTISVREAALIQTFPPTYIFDTPFMEYACTIIGNALPCTFAEALARHCRSAIDGHLESKAKPTKK